jgi:hypothetical protein
MDVFMLEDRETNVVHLVYYNAWYGQKYTFCGKYYSDQDKTNTIALSGPISGCCKTCSANAFKSCDSELDDNPRGFRKKNSRLLMGSYYAAKGGLGVSRRFIGMDETWYKLTKYKYKLKRTK